jgi:hypothetical protein
MSASYASTVLATTLVGVYSIATLSIGILLVSLVMVRGGFSPAAGYIGLATGVLGIVSVAGPVFVAGLGAAVILASVLTTLWALLVGYRLVRLGQASAVRTGTPALIT